MKYDFTTIMDRRGKDAMAVDNIPYENGITREGFSQIPMWVADMNFATAPSVTRAMAERIAHPAFGYYSPSEAYYDTIIRWQKERNGVEDLTPECIKYENGVLGGMLSAANAFCSQGDYVLLHSPTYIGFTNDLTRAGYRIILTDLIRDADGVWRMDYEDMDRKLKQYQIHLAVFCSPHNPCGRVWEKEEIEKAMEVYAANDCIVVSDEIWSDILLDGHRHIPTQSVSEDAKMRTIALYAPSKTFNLAGLIGSYHIIYNSYLRDRVRAQGSKSGYNHMNVLSMHALIGAYSDEGATWVDELCEVLSQNVSYAYDFIEKHFDGVELYHPQGTYMMYLDCEKWCLANKKSLDELLNAGAEVGVIWQDGRPFHRPYAIRLNLALPFSLVQEAFDRLDQYVFNLRS
ncbi:MAG: aminotransferase class I/II-fold pyridoxal phosphate-dependent enzyme [Clostridiales bacterium]|nr:aminotransferase class I/II-fold pyridoxal phosphate-dependent enzyme [Clostridiales bacterium]